MVSRDCFDLSPLLRNLLALVSMTEVMAKVYMMENSIF